MRVNATMVRKKLVVHAVATVTVNTKGILFVVIVDVNAIARLQLILLTLLLNPSFIVVTVVASRLQQDSLLKVESRCKCQSYKQEIKCKQVTITTVVKAVDCF